MAEDKRTEELKIDMPSDKTESKEKVLHDQTVDTKTTSSGEGKKHDAEKDPAKASDQSDKGKETTKTADQNGIVTGDKSGNVTPDDQGISFSASQFSDTNLAKANEETEANNNKVEEKRRHSDGEQNARNQYIPGEERGSFDSGKKEFRQLSVRHIKDRRGSAAKIENGGSGQGFVHNPRRRLSAKFESLDYNQPESQHFLMEQEGVKAKSVQQTAISRWLVNFLIGAYVALIAFLVAVLIEYISKLKFYLLYKMMGTCNEAKCTIAPTFVWMAFNTVLVTLGSYLVTYHAPHAAGSGIPQIKCYLNGIKLPGLLSLKTMVAKAGGIVLSVCGGLACGKEGPMIHSGAICASGMARGEIKCPGRKPYQIKMFKPLQSDTERRDFVSAGAAAGVSAAFGAPIGGVLFSLEEGASFVNQMLTWRMLFSSMTASLLLNIIMSAKKGHVENMSNPGLVSFGMMGDIDYKTYELPIFMVMAVFGGLCGALFNYLNLKITLVRRKLVTKNWAKVMEAALVAALSAVVLAALIYGVPDCAPAGHHVNGHHENHSNVLMGAHGADANVHNVAYAANLSHDTSHDPHHKIEAMQLHVMPTNATSGHNKSSGHDKGDHSEGGHGLLQMRGLCPEGQVNRMAQILFGTPEHGLHSVLHADKDAWSFGALGILFAVYFLLACWTYGLMVSSGLFIPSLLIGAIWGRLFGMAVMKFIPGAGTNIGKYCLVGAACQLGGTVRMTISLTVIVIECTGDITFGIPIMLSLIIAKWMGDFFNTGIYDLHIEILGIPLLPWEPPELCYNLKACEVMSSPVQTLRSVEKVGNLVRLVKEGGHNGFPVVEDYNPKGFTDTGTYGRCVGFILKKQIEDIVKEHHHEAFTNEEMESWVDLKMHMDASPYTIRENVSLPRIFKLFRGLGLRHLVVVNDCNQVVGICTRKDLAVFRGEAKKGKFVVERLDITDK